MILPLEYKSKKKKKFSEKIVRKKIFYKSNNNLDLSYIFQQALIAQFGRAIDL